MTTIKITQYSTIITETTDQDTKVFIEYNDGEDAFVTLPIRVHPSKVEAYIKHITEKFTCGFNSTIEAARYMGHIKSESKAAAARENGRKGGRPRKTQAPA